MFSLPVNSQIQRCWLNGGGLLIGRICPIFCLFIYDISISRLSFLISTSRWITVCGAQQRALRLTRRKHPMTITMTFRTNEKGGITEMIPRRVFTRFSIFPMQSHPDVPASGIIQAGKRLRLPRPSPTEST